MDLREVFDEIAKESFTSEVAEKLRQRMHKYHTKLFLFLDYDGIPLVLIPTDTFTCQNYFGINGTYMYIFHKIPAF